MEYKTKERNPEIQKLFPVKGYYIGLSIYASQINFEGANHGRYLFTFHSQLFVVRMLIERNKIRCKYIKTKL